MDDRFVQAGQAIRAAVDRPEMEIAAAREATAVVPIPWLGLLEARGPDAVSFLQGMLTQDLVSMRPGEARPACILDRRGRLMADLHVRRVALGIDLLAQVDRIETVREWLDRYLILEQVRIEPAPRAGALLVTGPGSLESVAAAGLDGWQVEMAAGPDILLVGDRIDEWEQALVDRGARRIGGIVLNRLRIEAGKPWFGREMDERNLPMELGMEAALSLEKGCYVGQETVARVHSRGKVKRRLAGVRIARGPLEPGMEATAGDRSVGVVTSAAAPIDGGGWLGLLLAPADLEAGVEVEIAGGRGRIERLPFIRISAQETT